MNISEGTQNLIAELKEFSNSKLINTDDLTVLVEASKMLNKEKLFDELIFTAKYLNGLGRILQGNIIGRRQEQKLNGDIQAELPDEALEKIKQEYKDNLKKLMSGLRDLIGALEESEKQPFESKYLNLNSDSLAHLTQLVYDLAWLKTFKNRLKQK